MSKLQKTTIIVLLVLLAVISVTKIMPLVTDPDFNNHASEITENHISTVMTLSGGAAGTSATLSLLPGDMCTPLAEQLAEMATYFLLILSALYLENFLITLSGYITFGLLIPVACFFFGLWVITEDRNHVRTGGKIALLGILIFIMVPTSVWLSDMVYKTQEAKVESAVEDYNNLEIEDESGSGFLNELTTLTTETINKVTDFLGSLIESLAVMIVTACIIPILVFVFFVWLVKTIFSANVLSLDPNMTKLLKRALKEDKNKPERIE
ncbi:MAG: hypothetical protein K6A23_12815 [Butyrivibrio sp.]|nr:hypothetical protein [Butyrivibrio sp.]